MKLKLSILPVILFFVFINLKAQQVVELPLSTFSFSDPEQHILIGENTVMGDSLFTEMAGLAISYKILSKEKDSTQDLDIIIQYDDRLKETVSRKISPLPKKGILKIVLKHSSGRKVKSIQVKGLNKRVNMQFKGINYSTGPKAFTLKDSDYKDASFADNMKSENDILITYRPINGPPFITRLKHYKLNLTASATGENPEAIKAGSVLVLTAIASDKSWMEDYKIEITGDVKEYDFTIVGHDVSKGIILIFQADLNQPDIAIRRIIVHD
jgi:uncharacterized membrane protein YkoI